MNIAVTGCISSDPCHLYADRSFEIDFSDRNDMYDLIKQQNFDYVIPTCNDISYMSCAWAAEQLDFPGFDDYATATILHTKDAFRHYAEKERLPIPFALPAENVDADTLNYPVLVKPVDAFSGRGMSKIYRATDLQAAISKAQTSSHSGKAIVEEFVEGSLHSHSAFLSKGKISYDTFADEFCTVYPYQVDCSNIPTSLPENIKQQVRQHILHMASTLHLHDGLLHTQFITDRNKLWLIECMRRCPGDLYGTLVNMAEGIDYSDLYLRPFIGEPLPSVQPHPSKWMARHTLSVAKEQTYTSFSHHIPSENVKIFPLKNSGEHFYAAPYDKAGILFAEFTDRQQLDEITPNLANYLTFDHLELSLANLSPSKTT